MTRKSLSTAIFIVFMLVYLNSYALACFNPTDSFAVEVLLNKPDVEYNLTKVRQAQNVGIRNESFVYRSHFNEMVAVVLIEEKNEVLNGLSVRIQIPTKSVVQEAVATNVSIELKDVRIEEIDRELFTSLGYKVNVREENREGIELVSISLIKDEVNINIGEFWEEEKVRTEFNATVNNAETLSPETRDEFTKILNSLGTHDNALDSAKVRVDRWEQSDLSSAIGIAKEEFDFSEAIKVELQWLKEHQILFGLQQRDIEEISQKARAGISGWNSRFVYENGKWLPYHETDAPMLLRDNGGGCGGFNIDNIPEGQLLLSNASNVSPQNRLAVTWGSLKVLVSQL